MSTGKKMQATREGKAKFHAFLLPENKNIQEDLDNWEEKDVPTKKMPVFYNPRMLLNRDLSVMAIDALKGAFRYGCNIADVMCGVGIRGIRYLVEASTEDMHVDFVDINPAATMTCKKNLQLNKIEDSRFEIYNKDANEFLYEKGLIEESRFHAIDIDPFGNPMQYISGAIKALRRDGLLQVVATDLAVLAGVHWKAARRKYLVRPLRPVSYHAEVAIRILFGAIFRKAIELDATIKPVFSMARNHYIKLTVQKQYGASNANADFHNLGYMIHCRDCLQHYTVELDDLIDVKKCQFCSSIKLRYGGPLWIGELQDKEKINNILSNANSKLEYMKKFNESIKILKFCAESFGFPPGSQDIHVISKELSHSPPTLEEIIEELGLMGIPASRDVFNPVALKTPGTRNEIKEAFNRAIARRT